MIHTESEHFQFDTQNEATDYSRDTEVSDGNLQYRQRSPYKEIINILYTLDWKTATLLDFLDTVISDQTLTTDFIKKVYPTLKRLKGSLLLSDIASADLSTYLHLRDIGSLTIIFFHRIGLYELKKSDLNHPDFKTSLSAVQKKKIETELFPDPSLSDEKQSISDEE